MLGTHLAKQFDAKRQKITWPNALVACRFRYISSNTIFRWWIVSGFVYACWVDLIVREHTKSQIISFDWQQLWTVGYAYSDAMKTCTPCPLWCRPWTFSPATTIGVITILNQMTIALWISRHIKDGLTIWMPEECPNIDWCCRETADCCSTEG